MTSEARDISPNIHQRMHAVMKAVRGVKKSEFNPHGKFRYAGHEQVTAALRDEYVKHGILRTASVTNSDRNAQNTLTLTVRVCWVNVDNPTDYVHAFTVGEAPSSSKEGKATGQQAGIALSYAVKLAEFKAFSLTGDDTPNPEDSDESNAAVDEFVSRFESATTMDEIEAIGAEIRREWASVSSGRAALIEARQVATTRLAAK